MPLLITNQRIGNGNCPQHFFLTPALVETRKSLTEKSALNALISLSRSKAGVDPSSRK